MIAAEALLTAGFLVDAIAAQALLTTEEIGAASTTLEGEIATVQGNVDALGTEVTTLNGDVDDLQVKTAYQSATLGTTSFAGGLSNSGNVNLGTPLTSTITLEGSVLTINALSINLNGVVSSPSFSMSNGFFNQF